MSYERFRKTIFIRRLNYCQILHNTGSAVSGLITEVWKRPETGSFTGEKLHPEEDSMKTRRPLEFFGFWIFDSFFLTNAAWSGVISYHVYMYCHNNANKK